MGIYTQKKIYIQTHHTACACSYGTKSQKNVRKMIKKLNS